jgi:hypothetical protein
MYIAHKPRVPFCVGTAASQEKRLLVDIHNFLEIVVAQDGVPVLIYLHAINSDS